MAHPIRNRGDWATSRVAGGEVLGALEILPSEEIEIGEYSGDQLGHVGVARDSIASSTPLLGGFRPSCRRLGQQPSLQFFLPLAQQRRSVLDSEASCRNSMARCPAMRDVCQE
jgi:hypothetical protein